MSLLFNLLHVDCRSPSVNLRQFLQKSLIKEFCQSIPDIIHLTPENNESREHLSQYSLNFLPLNTTPSHLNDTNHAHCASLYTRGLFNRFVTAEGEEGDGNSFFWNFFFGYISIWRGMFLGVKILENFDPIWGFHPNFLLQNSFFLVISHIEVSRGPIVCREECI